MARLPVKGNLLLVAGPAALLLWAVSAAETTAPPAPPLAAPPGAVAPATAAPKVAPADLPDPALGNLDYALQLNRIQQPELDVAAAKAEFEKLVGEARTALAVAATPREKVEALNQVLLTDRKVSYLSNLYWRDATLAAALQRRQGNCLAISTLYVLVGEELRLPIKLVLMPRHAFARWDNGKTRINIETTGGEQELPDARYLEQAEAMPEDARALGWGESLGPASFRAVLLETASDYRAGENRLEAALDLMKAAEELAPKRSDLTLKRLRLWAEVTGRREEARAAFQFFLRRKLPPSVATEALIYLATGSGGAGRHEEERELLMTAFVRAPKLHQYTVLALLAFCHRALKDPRGAVRYMELAAALRPDDDGTLYNLAILQKCDGRLEEALRTIARARALNPEHWGLQCLEAGYLVLNGRREEGMRKFAALGAPRGEADFHQIMRAWFCAVSRQREAFYLEFTKALESARTTGILEWIDQDVDLDAHRNEPEFKALVEKHAARLRNPPLAPEPKEQP